MTPYVQYISSISQDCLAPRVAKLRTQYTADVEKGDADYAEAKQKTDIVPGIPGDGLHRTPAVRHTRQVAQIDHVRFRKHRPELTKHRQPANAAVKHADAPRHSLHLSRIFYTIAVRCATENAPFGQEKPALLRGRQKAGSSFQLG